MEIIYSKHARRRMKERGITELEAKDVIDYPTFIRRHKDKIEAIGKIKNRRIRVIFQEKENYKKIITVM